MMETSSITLYLPTRYIPLSLKSSMLLELYLYLALNSVRAVLGYYIYILYVLFFYKPCPLLAATYDVQYTTAEVIGSEIEMTLQFINNSRAVGGLLVFQSYNGPPDEFRVLLRSGSDLTVTAMISVPPSTYTLYVYDLEEDGMPNKMPAILPEDRIHVITGCKLTETTYQNYINRRRNAN